MRPFTVSEDCQIPVLADVLTRHLTECDVGYFVEVGAFDGRSWTNTGFLADSGWNGLYIEPVAEYARRCRDNHRDNQVIIEQCAIGSEESTGDIWIAGGLSTLNETAKLAHERMYNAVNLEVQRTDILRLDTLLLKHNVDRNFELLVVDTEGYELEVFKSFSFNDYRPKLMIVELCDVHGGYNNYPLLQNNARLTRELILANDYIELYRDGINTIFKDVK